MITPTLLETEIRETILAAVEKLYAARQTSNTAWTRRMKEDLGHLGYSREFTTCAAGFKGTFERGWLYDLVWYEEDTKGFLLSVPLVVESEWLEKFSEIKFDFEKLLSARATHRLMICQCRTRYKEERLQYFRDAVKVYRHRQPGDRYLIALWDIGQQAFHFELIVLSDLDTVESTSIPIPKKIT
jgi:hypothetical protein